MYQYHEYSTVVYACENKLDLTNSFFKKSPPKFLEAVPFQGRSSQSFLIQPVQVVSNDEEHSAFDPIPNFASRSQNSITFGDFDFNQDQTGDLNWADGPDFVDLSHMFDGTSLDLMELNSISGGDSQNGDSSPKKSNAIGNRIQASSTKELLTKILTRFNLQHEIKSLENHGCWCPFLKDSIIGGHLGHPVDDLDSLCRSHHTCMNCARFEPSPCSDYLISQPDFANSPDNILDDNYYLFFNQKDGIWECEDRQDSCLRENFGKFSGD